MDAVMHMLRIFCCCFRKPASSNYEKKTFKFPHLRKETTNEEHKYSRSQRYYPEDLIYADTLSGIGERQDDFIKKQKSVNTNKKMATDLNTLLH